MAGSLFSGCPLRLLAMGLLAVMFCASSVDGEKDGSRRSQEKKSHWSESPTGDRTSSPPPPSSNDLETSGGKIRSIDSQDAWLLLVQQSKNGGKSKKRSKNQSRLLKPGLPGPPGPAGPPGPPGAIITQEEMLREFKLLLKGLIREQERINQKACDHCQEEEDWEIGEDNFLAQISGLLLESREQGRVEAAFHCRTRRNISIERRSLQEIHHYYIVYVNEKICIHSFTSLGKCPEGVKMRSGFGVCTLGCQIHSKLTWHFPKYWPKKEEMFHRGIGLNLNSGHYTAPLSGYYIFTATLHIVYEDHQKNNNLRIRDRLRLLICIQSLCRQNISLEMVHSLHRNSDHFTVSVHGILFLQAGQYASVFVDNATGSSITVRNGSDFGAVLLGV